MAEHRRPLFFVALILMAFVAWLLSLLAGPPVTGEPVTPRFVTGFSVGAMLAMAGVLLQVLLRNPLAEPYVLGISGGATVATLAVMVSGLGGFWLTGSAFVGSLLSMVTVFVLGRSAGPLSSERTLLTGIVLAAGWSALISFLLAIGPEQSLREHLFWLMGDLAHPASPWWALLVLLLAWIAGWVMATGLDLMARGDEMAMVLGVEVWRMRLTCYLLVALLVALAVSLAGPIGFVGLLVPHLMRLLVGAQHRLLIPAALLSGGSVMVLLDLLARQLVADGQLPVGVLTAVVGVPVFLWLLRRQGRAG